MAKKTPEGVWFAKRVKSLLRRKGQQQKELVPPLKDESAVSRLINGSGNPGLATIAKLARHFKMSLEEFFTDAQMPEIYRKHPDLMSDLNDVLSSGDEGAIETVQNALAVAIRSLDGRITARSGPIESGQRRVSSR